MPSTPTSPTLPSLPSLPTVHAPAAWVSRQVATLLTGLLLVVLSAPAALAHDELTGSTPEDGAVLSEAPEELRLTYSGDISDVGAQVQITGPDGAVLDGELTVEGTDVVHTMPADLAPGEYAVVWRVTSADGHPISGQLGFTVQDLPGTTDVGGSETGSIATPNAATPNAETPSTETGSDATTATSPAPEPAPADASEDADEDSAAPQVTARSDAPIAADQPGADGGGVPLWAWGAIAVALITLGGLGVTALRRRDG